MNNSDGLQWTYNIHAEQAELELMTLLLRLFYDYEEARRPDIEKWNWNVDIPATIEALDRSQGGSMLISVTDQDTLTPLIKLLDSITAELPTINQTSDAGKARLWQLRDALITHLDKNICNTTTNVELAVLD